MTTATDVPFFILFYYYDEFGVICKENDQNAPSHSSFIFSCFDLSSPLVASKTALDRWHLSHLSNCFYIKLYNLQHTASWTGDWNRDASMSLVYYNMVFTTYGMAKEWSKRGSVPGLWFLFYISGSDYYSVQFTARRPLMQRVFYFPFYGGVGFTTLFCLGVFWYIRAHSSF